MAAARPRRLSALACALAAPVPGAPCAGAVQLHAGGGAQGGRAAPGAPACRLPGARAEQHLQRRGQHAGCSASPIPRSLGLKKPAMAARCRSLLPAKDKGGLDAALSTFWCVSNDERCLPMAWTRRRTCCTCCCTWREASSTSTTPALCTAVRAWLRPACCLCGAHAWRAASTCLAFVDSELRNLARAGRLTCAHQVLTRRAVRTAALRAHPCRPQAGQHHAQARRVRALQGGGQAHGACTLHAPRTRFAHVAQARCCLGLPAWWRWWCAAVVAWCAWCGVAEAFSALRALGPGLSLDAPPRESRALDRHGITARLELITVPPQRVHSAFGVVPSLLCRRTSACPCRWVPRPRTCLALPPARPSSWPQRCALAAGTERAL